MIRDMRGRNDADRLMLIKQKKKRKPLANTILLATKHASRSSAQKLTPFSNPVSPTTVVDDEGGQQYHHDESESGAERNAKKQRLSNEEDKKRESSTPVLESAKDDNDQDASTPTKIINNQYPAPRLLKRQKKGLECTSEGFLSNMTIISQVIAEGRNKKKASRFSGAPPPPVSPQPGAKRRMRPPTGGLAGHAKKIAEFLQNAPRQRAFLGEACIALDIQRRRVLEIVHIFQGANLVTREDKNGTVRDAVCQWNNERSNEKKRRQLMLLRQDEVGKLDAWIAWLQRLASQKKYENLYVSETDLLKQQHQQDSTNSIHNDVDSNDENVHLVVKMAKGGSATSTIPSPTSVKQFSSAGSSSLRHSHILKVLGSPVSTASNSAPDSGPTADQHCPTIVYLLENRRRSGSPNHSIELLDDQQQQQQQQQPSALGKLTKLDFIPKTLQCYASDDDSLMLTTSDLVDKSRPGPPTFGVSAAKVMRTSPCAVALLVQDAIGTFPDEHMQYLSSASVAAMSEAAQQASIDNQQQQHQQHPWDIFSRPANKKKISQYHA